MYKNITTDITIAARYLNAGQLVAFPTETVYGLGADAKNEVAIAKVFAAKGRPADHPLIVHLADVAQLSAWAINIPVEAEVLAKHFWPGSLTMILPKHPTVSPLITGGQNTIGLRIPKHPLTLELLQKFGSGIVGPSANKYGFVSPTTAIHVATDLGDSVECILDGGACSVGIESTIVNLTTSPVTILRQGAITAEQISLVLGYSVATNTSSNSIRVSGSHAAHYAPHTPAYVLPMNDLLIKAAELAQQYKSFSVLSLHAKPQHLASNISWQHAPEDPVIYAHDLYSNLRAHDLLHNTAILIEQVPTKPEWAAIADRLQRASFKQI